MRKKIYLWAALLFIIDITTKLIIVKISNIYLPKEVFNNFFYLIYTKNTGAAFSILSDYTYLLILISGIVLIYINNYLSTTKVNKWQIISYSFIIGGIFGNLIDRIFYGYVIDFLSFKIFGYYFPIFNLADTFVCIGVFLYVIDIIRSGRNEINSK